MPELLLASKWIQLLDPLLALPWTKVFNYFLTSYFKAVDPDSKKGGHKYETDLFDPGSYL